MSPRPEPPKPKDGYKEQISKTLKQIKFAGIMYATTGFRPEKGPKSLKVRIEWALKMYDPKQFTAAEYPPAEIYKAGLIYNFLQFGSYQLSTANEANLKQAISLPFDVKKKNTWKKIKGFLKIKKN